MLEEKEDEPIFQVEPKAPAELLALPAEPARDPSPEDPEKKQLKQLFPCLAMTNKQT